MGGCRCTYRTCTVKTDGKTHMFHYPVFDKVRCHQWLLNANRLEFFNLKVSQLRNRVVCQHHFKDEQFMNYKKDKLKCDAVPSEDGPYCKTKNDNLERPNKICNITVQDIENDILTVTDKKANYSTKYVDFLRNNETNIPNILNASTPIKNKSLEEYNNNMNIQNNIQDSNCNNIEYYVTDKLDNYKNNEQPSQEQKINLNKNFDIQCKQAVPEMIKKYQSPPVVLMSPFCNNIDENIIKVELAPNFDNTWYTQLNTLNQNDVRISKDQQTPISTAKPTTNNRIKIISEKKISEPFPLPKKLRRISPTSIICGPNTEIKIQSNEATKSNILLDDKPTKYCVEIEVDKKYNNQNVEPHIGKTKEQKTNKNIMLTNKTFDNMEIDLSKKSSENSILNLGLSTSPKIAQLKNKISPERVAAIEEKRKFNMKLRDIIETCFDKLDEPYQVNEEVKQTNNTKKRIKQKETPKIESYHDRDLEHCNTNVSTIAILEERIKKMEETLSRKIDENSEKINELKFSMLPHPLQTKSVTTQIPANEESDKKRLYQEISKYLSPNAKSLIYEELFINKYTQKQKVSPPSKRRKAR
ncbi:uncharacterized protein PFD1115c-like [Achroia grisella]|uniref:uncharacterized protein PFD1115c-like n=1 Tax=Achroia grisella TaxID=688607 RepID=UPI0027D225D6|nr:uncharacterized protein PFD1115c-like [Achroia grisella]XP_059052263.1 uncharacterized protein PFD1115c-like [Achroia grisella]